MQTLNIVVNYVTFFVYFSVVILKIMEKVALSGCLVRFVITRCSVQFCPWNGPWGIVFRLQSIIILLFIFAFSGGIVHCFVC